jgi:hypothetical protein
VKLSEDAWFIWLWPVTFPLVAIAILMVYIVVGYFTIGEKLGGLCERFM